MSRVPGLSSTVSRVEGFPNSRPRESKTYHSPTMDCLEQSGGDKGFPMCLRFMLHHLGTGKPYLCYVCSRSGWTILRICRFASGRTPHSAAELFYLILHLSGIVAFALLYTSGCASEIDGRLGFDSDSIRDFADPSALSGFLAKSPAARRVLSATRSVLI